MSRRPIPIKVKSTDLTQIGEILRGGIQQVGVVMRALSLRQMADGFIAPEGAQALSITSKAVRQIGYRYMSDGLDAAVYAKQPLGAREILDGPQKQRIVAMVCSKPPGGRARWRVSLMGNPSGYWAARLMRLHRNGFGLPATRSSAFPDASHSSGRAERGRGVIPGRGMVRARS